MEIVIGESVGDFKYGMSREEVESIFGQAESIIEKNEDGDLELFYKDDSVQFIFYEVADYKLSNIVIDEDAGIDVFYNKNSLFEMHYNDIIPMFKEIGGEPEYDYLDYDGIDESEECVDFESIGVTLYFSQEKELVEISLSESIKS